MSLLRRLLPRTYMARRNLLRAKARSGLAVLTIVIGVVAIASLGSFGAAFQTAQLESIGEIGNEIMVSPGEDVDGFALDERDRRDVERIAGDREVIPLVWSGGVFDRTGEEIAVRGVDDPAAAYDVREGSIPDNWRSGAIVGAQFAEEHELEPGESISVDGETYRIHAVLEEEGQAGFGNPNDAVLLPVAELDAEGYNRLMIQADDPVEATQLAEEIRNDLNQREERVSVRDFSEIAQRIDEVFWQIQLFLLGVGAISLLVAGISIANVMLMSAIERREEIGVLRAVGYQRLDVLGIMLAEAMLLGVVGAVVGIGLSVLATMGINAVLLDDPYAFQAETLQYAILAFGFGVGASILAGLYPAWKASRKRPVEALRG